MSTASEARLLYRKLLKASLRLSDYNFRSYFYRRAREEFRRGEMSQERVAYAQEQLAMLERQATLQSLYYPGKSVIETVAKPQLD